MEFLKVSCSERWVSNEYIVRNPKDDETLHA